MSLPEAFIEKMTRLLGQEEAPAFFDSYEKPRAYGLRANLLKITPEQLQALVKFPLRPIAFCKTGFYFNPDDHPGRQAFHQAGLYYIQEPSAMAVAAFADAQPGEKVLDLCAAPGGKSTQLAAAMQQQGLLVANEIFPKRAKILSENIERMGIRNAIVTNEAPEKLADYFPGYFDKILVDAPCSGEGMFRKDPEAASYWSPEHVSECAALQSQILDQAYRMLKSGGALIYSTCTFSPEENERTIEAALERFPDLTVQALEKVGGIADARAEWSISQEKQLKQAARLWPHQLEGEGHFICKLLKTADSAEPRLHEAFSVKEAQLRDYHFFEKAALREPLSGCFQQYGNQLFLLPQSCPDLKPLRVIRAGLHLGEFKKNRFEPNHALALALPINQFQSVSALDNQSCDRYLRGEALPVSVDKKGWTIAALDGFPLGWGKATAGQLKNNYPKGLRRRGLVYPV